MTVEKKDSDSDCYYKSEPIVGEHWHLSGEHETKSKQKTLGEDFPWQSKSSKISNKHLI